MAKARRSSEVAVTAATLHLVRYPPLRAEAEAALARGERVLLFEGRSPDGARVETVVTASRAAQSAGGHVVRGVWAAGRLATDGDDHLLDPDGVCFCRDCEAAGGYTLDDDE